MLIQLHAIAPSERDFIAQCELPDGEAADTTLREWLHEMMARHELPAGAAWEVVTQDCDKFFWAAKQDTWRDRDQLL